jgi:hypothetical protein
MATGREVKAGRLATATRFVSSMIFNQLDVAKKSTQQLLRDQLHNEPWTIA